MESWLYGKDPDSNDPKKVRRARRVCGHMVGDEVDGVRCVRVAGSGTNHFGVGYCSKHRGSEFEERMFVLEYLRLNSVIRLEDIMDGTPISDEEMYSLKAEVVFLQSMLKVIVARNPDTVMSSSEQNIAVKLTSEIVKTKEAFTRMRSARLALSPKQIGDFVEQLLLIVRDVAGDLAVIECQKKFRDVMITFGRGATLPVVSQGES